MPLKSPRPEDDFGVAPAGAPDVPYAGSRGWCRRQGGRSMITRNYQIGRTRILVGVVDPVSG